MMLERFWAKIEKGDDCWLWTGATRGGGYGTFKYCGRTVSTHRYSYELFVGPIPDGLYVLHRCDVRACVNPAHLFLGTNADNLRDMVEKRRGNIGQRHGMSKLTDDDVRAIRIACADGESRASVAKRYPVHRSGIEKVVNGISWRHVT